jgi:hypothetical protein
MSKLLRLKIWATAFIFCILVLAGGMCRAAESTTAIGTIGTYAADQAAPDILTTTDPAKTLTVAGGTATPERVFDQGQVRLTGKQGNVATFAGRSTNWGCIYTVNGVYTAAGGGGKGGGPNTWASKFDNVKTPRITLEINLPGAADNQVATITKGGTLTVRVLDPAPLTTYSITATSSAANPTNGKGHVSISSISPLSAESPETTVDLEGTDLGVFTITANGDNGLAATTIDGTVVGVRIAVVFDQANSANAHGFSFTVKIKAIGVDLDKYEITQLANTSVSERDWQGTALTHDQIVASYGAIADTQGWVTDDLWDWAQLQAEQTDNQLDNVTNESVTIANQDYTQIRRHSASRDFKVEVRDKTTQTIVATYIWGYGWNNGDAVWKTTDNPPAPVPCCAGGFLGSGTFTGIYGIDQFPAAWQ